MQMQEPEGKRRKRLPKESEKVLNEVHEEAYIGNLSRLAPLYLEHKANGSQDPLDALKRSPLHYACLAGNIDCIRYLVEEGADLNLKVRIDILKNRLSRNLNF